MSDQDNKPQGNPNPQKPANGQTTEQKPKDEIPKPPPPGDAYKRNDDNREIKKR